MSTSKAKLKVASQEERLQKWKKKKHFQNLLRNSSEITDKPIQKIINGKLNIKLRQFTEEELDTVLKKKLKTQKLQALTKYPWSMEENLTMHNFYYAMLCINKT